MANIVGADDHGHFITSRRNIHTMRHPTAKGQKGPWVLAVFQQGHIAGRPKVAGVADNCDQRPGIHQHHVSADTRTIPASNGGRNHQIWHSVDRAGRQNQDVINTRERWFIIGPANRTPHRCDDIATGVKTSNARQLGG